MNGLVRGERISSGCVVGTFLQVGSIDESWVESVREHFLSLPRQSTGSKEEREAEPRDAIKDMKLIYQTQIHSVRCSIETMGDAIPSSSALFVADGYNRTLFCKDEFIGPVMRQSPTEMFGSCKIRAVLTSPGLSILAIAR